VYIDARFEHVNERGVSTMDTRPALSAKRVNGNKINTDNSADVGGKKIGRDTYSGNVDYKVLIRERRGCWVNE
jgi:hypothetical protein